MRRKRSSKGWFTNEKIVVFLFVILAFGYLNNASPNPIDPIVTPTPTPTYHGGGGGGGSTDPTPTPTPFLPTPLSGTNLAPISSWSLVYGTGPQIASLDTTVTFNGNPTIRLEPHTSADVNIAREIDTNWIHVHPGDHIVFRAWTKNEAHTNDLYSGSRIGIDFYGDGVLDGQPHGYKYIGGVWSSDGDENWIAGTYNTWVSYPTFVDTPVSEFLAPWGQSTWRLLEWDVIVPDYTYSMRMDGTPVTAQKITGIIAWMDARYVGDEATAWFANTELYINPT